MAAGKITIAEVEELLPAGSLELTKFIFRNHGTTHLSRRKV
jgi:acyl CoA:acetate/3-ketoacid CoA transferase alpha subunit